MKKFFKMFLILGLLSSSAYASGQLGESQMVDCIESVQSARYEGGDVREEAVQAPQSETGSGSSR